VTSTYIIAISMGPVLDRTREHVVAADRAVIHLRARLLESVRLNEDGQEPIGLAARVTDVKSLPDTVIPADGRWEALVPGNVTASPVKVGR
jgi:phthalate 4,5-dioxygenase oxygenase subunit